MIAPRESYRGLHNTDPFIFDGPAEEGFTGPAQHRAGGWQLLALFGAFDFDKAIEVQKKKREALYVLPRSWPASQPAQAPFKWA